MQPHQVVIIGAGTSGLSAAVALADRGIQPVLIDRADQVGYSWRSRYTDSPEHRTASSRTYPTRPYPKVNTDLPHPRPDDRPLEQHATMAESSCD